ncbi:MAG: lytic transglycosylase domain-containing protein [Cycloclasticus sp.]|nr:lytic transglycosylase domain-containing protein [Cycloclasticus sp.]MBQ0790429.1 lytic transglycosylase domain-containing protein [Cycloclasticus sp.]
MPLLSNLSLILSLLFMTVGSAQADLYKRVDDRGHVFFTDNPEGPGYKLIKRTPKKGTVAYKNFQQNRRTLTPLIQRQARESKVDPALVMAVIHAESAYDQYARSHAGAVGLMQLMPATAERFGVSNRTNVAENIRGGTQYLRYLLELFEFNIKLTLAAYNAGESAVSKYGNTIPPYPETQLYVKKVIEYYRDYLGQQKSS